MTGSLRCKSCNYKIATTINRFVTTYRNAYTISSYNFSCNFHSTLYYLIDKLTSQDNCTTYAECNAILATKYGIACYIVIKKIYTIYKQVYCVK